MRSHLRFSWSAIAFAGAGAGAMAFPSSAQAQTPTDNATTDAATDPSPRAEPQAQAPVDSLKMSDELSARVGSDFDGRRAPAQGELERSFAGYYQESRGDYRARLLPPFYLEHTRGLADPRHPERAAHPDRESLVSLLYYNRRSDAVDADVIFPLLWKIRSGNSYLLNIGPFVHREAYAAPGDARATETDNWLAPLYFQGTRRDGGYFHAPLLLTTSQWSPSRAFTWSLLYFRDRTGTDVDTGVAPFWFHGDNGDVEGARRTYTLAPPLLYYHRERELQQDAFTVAGPVIVETTPKREIVDVLPFFFHIKGKPEAQGVREEHTTLFPLFHYGYTDTESLFASPVYLRRITPKTDTLLTPFYQHAEGRSGATSLTLAGPVLPIYGHYTDRDLGVTATGVFPFFFTSNSPAGRDWVTPLVGQFETAGVSKTTWVFPTFTATRSPSGWENNLHPIAYFGRKGENSHAVIAPFFWDFASPRGRTTLGLPLFFRVSDTADDSVTQVAGNTLYLQKRVPGGLDWSFHLLPLFSYGQEPNGYFWNVLLGLAGYSRHGDAAQVRALWVPFEVGGSTPEQRRAAGR